MPALPVLDEISPSYDVVLALMGSAYPSELRELVPGRAETTVRLWEVAPVAMRMGCLEGVHQALREAVEEGKEEGVGARLGAIVDRWRPVCLSLRGKLPDGLSLRLDGQVLEFLAPGA
jgi:hypothetical protein